LNNTQNKEKYKSFLHEEKCLKYLQKKGIKDLYIPQKQALNLLLNDKSVVLNIPTATGKTLVANLYCFKILEKNKKIIYLAPLKSISRDKYSELTECYSGLNKKIGLFTSSGTSSESPEDYDIIIGTYEKLNSILSPSLLSKTSFVIIDEIHNIADPERGLSLDILIAKIKTSPNNIQLLSLSGTIGNPKLMSTWLDSNLVKSDWRPVEVKNKIIQKIGANDANKWIKKYCSSHEGNLVFVNTRKSTESLALSLVPKLKDKKISVQKKLKHCMKNGLAFHHAGILPSDQEKIEQYFLDKTIHTIVCTTTLAAGVNLPCHSVIIRDISRSSLTNGSWNNSEILPILEIKQMIGRAGRPGLSENKCYSYIIAKGIWGKGDIENHITIPIEDEYSQLKDDNLGETILKLFPTGYLEEDHINQLIGNMFPSSLNSLETDLKIKIQKNLKYLVTSKHLQKKGIKYTLTNKGRLVVNYFLSLSTVEFFSFLRDFITLNIAEPFPSEGFLTLVSFCKEIIKRPIGKIDPTLNPAEFISTFSSFYNIDSESQKIILRKIKDCNVSPGVILNQMAIIRDWINLEPIESIRKKWNQMYDADLYRIISSYEWILYSFLQIISEKEEKNNIKILIKRIKYGIPTSHIDLCSIPNVGRIRASILYNAGIRTSIDFKNSSPDKIQKILGVEKTYFKTPNP